MDFVLLTKFITFFLYPMGAVSILLVIALASYLFGRRRKSACLCVCALFIVWFFSTPLVALSLVGSLEQRYAVMSVNKVQPHASIVVLGGGLRLPAAPVYRPQFTHATDRYWYAVKLYKAGLAPSIIILGGNAVHQPGIKGEAYYAKQLLQSWGVPESAIFTDQKSRTTAQNAQALTNVLKAASLDNTEAPLDLVLVTSALHMPRAMQLFEAVHSDLNFTPAIADVLLTDTERPWLSLLIPQASSLDLATRALHEYYGALFAHLQLRFG